MSTDPTAKVSFYSFQKLCKKLKVTALSQVATKRRTEITAEWLAIKDTINWQKILAKYLIQFQN